MVQQASPLISVVIPTYRRPDHLARAIGSVLAEPGDYFELVVGDDASPDDTPVVVARFAKDSRLRHFRNEKNLGLQANVHKTVRAAVGAYIFILTDDDYLVSGALAKIKAAIVDAPDVGYLLSDLATVDERTGKIIDFYRALPTPMLVPASLHNMATSVRAAWVLSRQVLKRECIDWVTWDKFAQNIFFPIIVAGRLMMQAPFAYLTEPLVMHTQFNEVFWHRFGPNELEIQFNLDADAYRCMRAILWDYPITPETQKVITQWERGCFLTYLYRPYKGFYDYMRTNGVRQALLRLRSVYPLDGRQKWALFVFALKLPYLRAAVIARNWARRLPLSLLERYRIARFPRDMNLPGENN